MQLTRMKSLHQCADFIFEKGTLVLKNLNGIIYNISLHEKDEFVKTLNQLRIFFL